MAANIRLVSESEIQELEKQLTELKESLADWSGDLSSVENTVSEIITVVQSLSSVARTGDYNDLINKPSIPTVPENISSFTNDAGYLGSDDVSNVAISGKYADLTGKPTIPAAVTKTSQLENDSGFTTANDLNELNSNLSQLISKVELIEQKLEALNPESGSETE
ncbi:hypothetical protein [Shouchella clausii]|uniref:hypothetical protein n=1 Tax=Shouchella clausii TaxID=79880 RepID=UPI001C73CD70|nr:hypothetical protein [Shouchella clausii]MBX0320182.1 hypothetical protein [Shouchella clausii]